MGTITLTGTNKAAVLVLAIMVSTISACQTPLDNFSGLASSRSVKSSSPLASSNPLEAVKAQSIPFRPDLEQALEEGLLSNESHDLKPSYYAEEFRLVIPIASSGQGEPADIDIYLQPLLNKIASWAMVRQVTVIGHSDSEGSELSNMLLSVRRASAVADRLEDLGVEAGLLIVEAYGEEQPIGDNTSLDGRIANRRVEVVVTGYPQTPVLSGSQLAEGSQMVDSSKLPKGSQLAVSNKL